MNQSVAIIGASKDRSKFGNKAIRAFAAEGWTVYPINPKEPEIEGLVCYASIAEVPEPIDRVSMYVPPEIGRQMLSEIAEKNPDELFFNPGSESPELLSSAAAIGLNSVAACSIVDIGRAPSEFPDT